MTDTMNGIVARIALRAKQLADQSIDMLRMEYPETTETASELVRLCKQLKLTQGEMIEAILIEEFCVEFDFTVSE